MSEDGILGVKETFHRVKWKSYFDPVFRTTVLKSAFIDIVISKPLVNLVQCLSRRLYKFMHLLLRKILTVAGVGWI